MNEREKRVRQEISGILAEKSPAGRREYIRDTKAFLYTENRRIRDKEIEKLLKEKDQHVYKMR